MDGTEEWLHIDSTAPHDDYLRFHISRVASSAKSSSSSVNEVPACVTEEKKKSPFIDDDYDAFDSDLKFNISPIRIRFNEEKKEASPLMDSVLHELPVLDLEQPFRPKKRSQLNASKSQQSRSLGQKTITNRNIKDTENQRRKACPRLWNPEEDRLLLEVVKSTPHPLKWPAVAKSLPNRTGKQCRERYLNHLSPKLKQANWTPEEDTTMITLYFKFGPQWANMTKMIKGRTDNSIKNRFHHQRRRMEKDEVRAGKFRTLDMFHNEIRLDKIKPPRENVRSELQCRIHQILGYLSAQSVIGDGASFTDYRFGPWRSPCEEQCTRCQYFVPSIQCGTKICDRTGWCESCTRIPAYVTGDLLRECLNLRKRC